MKLGIHPVYSVSQVTCACGSTFATRSVRPVIRVEVCSECHPFYTGRQKLMDTAGRVDRFKKMFAKTEGKMVERKPVAELKMKKLESATGRKKVLSTAPTKKDEKAEKKPAKKAA